MLPVEAPVVASATTQRGDGREHSRRTVGRAGGAIRESSDFASGHRRVATALPGDGSPAVLPRSSPALRRGRAETRTGPRIDRVHPRTLPDQVTAGIRAAEVLK